MEFPLFRKYSGIETYFKVGSESAFQELKISDQFYSLNDFEALNHFDRLFISDLISLHENRWVEISGQEYLQRVKECEQHLKRIP